MNNGKERRFGKWTKFLYLAAAILFSLIATWAILSRDKTDSVSFGSGQVLGKETGAGRLYIFRDEQDYGSNGLFSLIKGSEPSIWLRGEGISGNVDISLYHGDEEVLKKFLTYREREEGGFEKKQDFLELDGQTLLTSFEENLSSEERRKVVLPISEKEGVWVVRVEQGSVRSEAVILISSFSALVKESDDKLVFWAQDSVSGKGLSDVSISTYNLKENPSLLRETKTAAQGIAEMPINEEADVAVLRRASGLALIPLNLASMDYRYAIFEKKVVSTKYFTFTDRSLYRPGDVVHFKSILRSDDDAAYAVPVGNARVEVYTGWGEEKKTIYEKTIALSEYGTVDGTFDLAPDASVGEYYLKIRLSGESKENDWETQAWFNVQEFRKPEYTLDIDSEKDVYIAGDKMYFKVKGEYFSGEPLAGGTVKYSAGANNFYEYDYLDGQSYALNEDYRYYGNYVNDSLGSGEIVLDQNGEAEIMVEAKLPSGSRGNQVVSLEVNFEQSGGEPVFERKNVLMYASDFGIYRASQDWSYAAEIGKEAKIPLKIVPYRGGIAVEKISIVAECEREYWEEVPETESTPLGYRRLSEKLPEIGGMSDGKGDVVLSFVPEKPGSYQFEIKAVDERGNVAYREAWLWVPEKSGFFYSFRNQEAENEQGLAIRTDKAIYEPGEKARVTVSSTASDRDVFLSIERGRMSKYFILALKDHSQTFELKLDDSDLPNRYLVATTFAGGKHYRKEEKISVSAEKKRLDLKITSDRPTYGPGDTVSLEVEATDQKGVPLEAEVALFAVDKAIFELAGSNKKDIFEEFYRERYNSTVDSHSLVGIVMYGAEMGCFVSGTKVLMQDGQEKAIEDIVPGDFVLTRKSETESDLVSAEVVGKHEVEALGFLIINGELRVTPEHRLFVNGKWLMAGDVQIGDQLIGKDGLPVGISSIEWLRKKARVYNLIVKDRHTYFAGGVFVHNEKGGGGSRSVFRDTAYWNPSILTDAKGKARVTFVLPDNLTTWVLASYATTKDTKVGEATEEIKVTKSVIMRPTLPNILRIGDEVILESLLQNFSKDDETFSVGLEFSAGSVTEGAKQEIKLASGESQQLYFTVKPERETELAELKFFATGKNGQNSDIVKLTIPVYSAGYHVWKSAVGSDKNAAVYAFSSEADPKKSAMYVSLAPNLLGTIPEAMEYLVDYPYGCMEQTMSRLVPLIVASEHKDLYGESLKNKDVGKMMHEGLLRLESHQMENGGFPWWWKDEPDPFVSWYVARYLFELRNVSELKMEDRDLLEILTGRLANYLQSEKFLWPERAFSGKNEEEKRALINEREILKNSALAYLGFPAEVLTDFSGVRSDILAIAVLHNARQGFFDSQANGLNQLKSLQKKDSSGGVYWEGGPSSRFGSEDASTALALQALVTFSDEDDLAGLAARFLSNNRRRAFWSNTFATAQAIEAITLFTEKNSKTDPRYNYQLFAGEKMLESGAVNNFRDRKELAVSLADLPAKEGELMVRLSGEGEAYLVARTDEFRLGKNLTSENRGIVITREYLPEKGKKNIGIGDTVLVRIKIENSSPKDDYLVVKDELPSGLIPVNMAFKNSQGIDRANTAILFGSEIGKTGVTFAAYGNAVTQHEYAARAVAAGKFFVPPVQASLMYAPEVYGISKTEELEIAIKSDLQTKQSVLRGESGGRVALLTVIILLILSGGGFAGWLIFRQRRKRRGEVEKSANSALAENKSLESEAKNNLHE